MRIVYLGGLFTLSLIFTASSFARQSTIESIRATLQAEPDDSSRVEIMMQLVALYSQTNPDSSIWFGLEARDLARQIGNPVLTARSLHYLGRAYIRGAEYGNAIATLREARNLIDQDDSQTLLKAHIIRNIGNIYFIQYQQEEAMTFYRDALVIFEALNDSVGMSSVYSNFANIYYETFYEDSTRLDSALIYYGKALAISQAQNDEMGVGSAYLNIGMLYEKMDSLDKAIEYSKKAVEIADRNNALVMKTYPLKVLSTVSRKQKQYEESLAYAEQSLEIAKTMGINYEEKDAHLNLADTYREMGDFEKAYFHYTSYDALNDSLLNEDANARLAEMQASYESEKKEQEIEVLAAQNEMQKARIAAVTSGLALVLVTAIVGVLWFASRKRKELQLLEKDKVIAESRKLLAEEELMNSKIREENLRKELTNYALHIVEKNDFLEEVKVEMAELRMDIQNTEAIKHINKLGSKIYQNLMLNKDREEFEIQVEQACDGFFKTLEREHPDLTAQERRLAALLRLNLSSKEISGIMNISPKSVDQSRYRLRKKLHLEKESNLSTFLNQI